MNNITDIISPLVFAGHMDAKHSPYNYVPTKGIAILYIVLFGLSTLMHTGQAIFFRLWWLFPTVCLAGIIEVLGWSGRLWSSFSPSFIEPFQIQICGTILAPTPLVAANFVILGRIIQRLGPKYSRLSPKWYTIVFCSFDLISLIIQGVGGGMAAVAAGNNRDPTPGGNIMLGGIVFQMVTITIYASLAGEFFFRYFKDLPVRHLGSKEADGSFDSDRGFLNKRIKLMSLALSFNTLCLFIRSVYRTIELSDGWGGRIISTQVYFNVLDGAMVVLAIYTLNIAHPGFLLGSPKSHTTNNPLTTGDKDSHRDSKGTLA